ISQQAVSAADLNEGTYVSPPHPLRFEHRFLRRAFEALQRLGDLGLARPRLLALFAFAFDDLLRRALEEVGIAELGVDAGDVRIALGHFLGEPRTLGGKIDQPRKN